MNKFDESKVVWVVDPGHAWLQVPVNSAEGLEFSEFSYIDPAGLWFYLEEDCDAGVWLDHHGVSGKDFPAHSLDHMSLIRHLPRFSPASV